MFPSPHETLAIVPEQSHDRLFCCICWFPCHVQYAILPNFRYLCLYSGCVCVCVCVCVRGGDLLLMEVWWYGVCIKYSNAFTKTINPHRTVTFVGERLPEFNCNLVTIMNFCLNIAALKEYFCSSLPPSSLSVPPCRTKCCRVRFKPTVEIRVAQGVWCWFIQWPPSLALTGPHPALQYGNRGRAWYMILCAHCVFKNDQWNWQAMFCVLFKQLHVQCLRCADHSPVVGWVHASMYGTSNIHCITVVDPINSIT